MIIEKVLGNTHDLPPGPDPYFGLHREKVVLPSAQLVKRIQRVTTDHGKELGIRLPAGSGGPARRRHPARGRRPT